MDHETIDRQLAARPLHEERDAWKQRRRLTIGASEVPLALMTVDAVSADGRAFHKEQMKITRTRHGELPFWIARKLGLRKPLREDSAMRSGRQLESEVVAEARRLNKLGAYEMASSVPQEWLPLVDRECPTLSCTPDGWCRDWLGELVAIEIKCTRDFPGSFPDRPLWYWHAQALAECAVTGASSALIVCGPGWAIDRTKLKTPMDYAAPRVWAIRRDDAAIGRIRAAVVKVGEIISKVKEEMANG
jgi:hypothetical protein